jgi:hypothetical protein
LRHRPFRRRAEFSVIPVEPGIFSIVLEKCRVGTENGEPNQAFASQFP